MTDNIKEKSEKYISTLKKIIPEDSVDRLIEFIGVDLFLAPASISYFNAYDGGLVDLLLRTAKYSIYLNKLYHENIRLPENKLLKVSLLHQIGGAKKYVINENVNERLNGIIYVYNQNFGSFRTSEKTIYYLMKCNIEIDEDEFCAIINYDKPETDNQSKYFNNLLGETLKNALFLAIKEVQNLK